MRRLSISLITGGVLLVLASVGLFAYNLSQLYSLAGECTADPCEATTTTELKDRKRLQVYARMGMLGGLALGVAGVIAFRRAEESRLKRNKGNKLFY